MRIEPTRKLLFHYYEFFCHSKFIKNSINCYFIITSSSVIKNSSKIAWSTKLKVTFQNTNQSPNTEIGSQTTSAHELQLIDSHLPVSTTFVAEHGACFWSWASDSAWRDWLWQGKGFKNFFGDTDTLKISRKPSLTPQNLKGPLKKSCSKNLKPSYINWSPPPKKRYFLAPLKFKGPPQNLTGPLKS